MIWITVFAFGCLVGGVVGWGVCLAIRVQSEIRREDQAYWNGVQVGWEMRGVK